MIKISLYSLVPLPLNFFYLLVFLQFLLNVNNAIFFLSIMYSIIQIIIPGPLPLTCPFWILTWYFFFSLLEFAISLTNILQRLCNINNLLENIFIQYLVLVHQVTSIKHGCGIGKERNCLSKSKGCTCNPVKLIYWTKDHFAVITVLCS